MAHRDVVIDADHRALRSLVARLVRAAVSDTRSAAAGGGAVSDTRLGESGAAGGGAVSATRLGESGTAGGGAVSDTLAAVVRRHMLGPLAHREGWPGFRGDHAAAAIQADRRSAVLAEAVAALGSAGIRVMLIKGIAYAGTIYPDPALRPMSDIDLLVPDTSYRAAIEALGRLGYWHAGTPDQLSAPNHGYTLKRKDGSIDVHRHITHAGRTSIDLAAVWRDVRPAHVVGAVRASVIHEYMIHIAHMARHELAVPAINIVDAALLRTAAHRGSTSDLDSLADRWRLGRAHRAVTRLLEDLELDRSSSNHGILPSVEEVLAGARPRRLLQVVRKVALTDDLRGVAALVSATVRGRLEHLRARG